jgi:hypothetical protein
MSDDDKPHLSLAPVVTLPCDTRLPIEVDRVLSEALGKLKNVVVIGWEHDHAEGGARFYFASDRADGGEVLWLLELARVKLLRAGGA